MATPTKRLDPRFYIAREPVIFAALSALGILAFLGVAGLVRVYHAQQNALGTRWFTRGVADLHASRFDHAVSDFRTALIYSRDNFSYQLNLAQALIGLKRTDEAYAYLVSLWEQQPENGLVNLELARIAAAKEDTSHALRYYHNAIYATWPNDGEAERRQTRLELVQYLLNNGAKTQAQSELIALAANIEEDPPQQFQIGELFLRAQDYEHALAAFRMSLKADHPIPEANAGAGLAAFELERYPVAQRYLQAAVEENPGDAQTTARLKTTELVLHLDPFQRDISAAQRNRIVVEAYDTAGERLKSCAASGALSASEQNLSQSWTTMKPNITERGLQKNQDLVNQAMQLVFDIERQTSATCGSPTDEDTALLLISKLHEGS